MTGTGSRSTGTPPTPSQLSSPAPPTGDDRKIRRILSDPGSAMLIEPADTGRYRVRIETTWVDITESEADLLTRIFENPA